MAENNLDININTKADKTEVVDLSEAISTLKEMDSNVEIDVNINNSEIEEVEHELKNITPQIDTEAHISDNGELAHWKDEIETINGRIVQIECDVNGNEIENARERIIDIDGQIINVDSNVDLEEVLFAKETIQEIQDDLVTVKLDVDDGNLTLTRSDIEEIADETISLNTNINEDDLNNLKNDINDLNNEVINLNTNIDEDDLNNLKDRVTDLNNEFIKIDFNVEDNNELDNLKSKISDLNNEIVSITPNVDDIQLNELKENILDLNNEIINFITEIDDSELINLENDVANLENENIDLDIDSSSIDDAESSVGNLSDSMGDASGSASDLSDSVADVDGSAIDDVSSSAGEADENLNKASESATNVGVSITNIDPSVLEQIALLAGASADEMDRLKNNADETSTSMTMVDAMASATLSATVTAGFMSASNAAGNYSDTMVRLGYALSDTSMTAEQAEQRYGGLISTMVDETGRGAGAVRAHLINMGNVGITSEQTLSESFEGISKAAFQMGESMDSMEMKFQTMALTGRAGSRQLKAFGLETQDLANVMGVSVDEVKDKFEEMDATSRANVLSTALNMKYGAEVTENYKNSYEHLMDTMNRAKDYFIRVVGEALLPVLIPTIQNAANIVNFLAESFKGLPSPIQGVIGSALSLVAGITAVGLGISATSKFISAAIAPFRLLIESERAAAIAQWLLNSSIWANPITWLVIAIIALIVVLGYLYFNNEQVRNAINGLGEAFVNAGQIIYNSVINFVNWVINSLQSLYTYIMTFGGLLQSNISITGNNIVDSVLGVMIFIATLPYQLAIIFTNMIAKTLGFGNNFVQRMVSAGVNSVSQFMSQISSLPGRFIGELNQMLSYVGQWAATLPAKFWEAGVNAVKNFLNALGIHSPGIMQTKLIKEIDDTGDRIPLASEKLVRNVGIVAKNAVKSFGNPKFNVGFDIDELNKLKSSNLELSNNSLLELLSSNTGNNNEKIINLTLNVGTVDKRERIDEIIDAVREYFLWNNTTAGRTV